MAALESFIERFPTHKLASRAHLDIATSYMHFGRYEDAAKALKRFLTDDRYKDREETPEGRQLLGRALQLQKKFPEALAAWQEYLARHPTHKAWSQVQREIVNTEYLMARDKMEAKQYEAAVKLFTEFLAKYPLDPRNPEVFYLFGQINHQRQNWEAAIADWQRLVSKYPGTDWASRGQYMIAETLEKHLGRLEEALEAYRKVTRGSYAGPAQLAAARLMAKRMAVATDRIFRSDEVPILTLTTRNVESVSVRAYQVDLETYFRKMHLARGVEGLDIALINPDRTFEFKVPKYAKYQELESALEVPLPGEARAGVMAVTVSTRTHEATTLVLQSDLDIIVKSSRNELFVFAENMRTGKPWPDVRLLISDGKQVFAEGTTGKDGVFRGEFKELKDAADVRVLAVAGRHVASNVVGLEGVGLAQGLSDKGYLYTDRPAYRAGDLVHLRGLLRRAAEDTYVIDKGKTYTLEVFDGRNRLVYQTSVALGEFGSFSADFTLPPESPQGQYRFSVRDEAGKSFAGTFLVQEYVLEPVRLVIDTPRRVYYRGEEIEGTIRAEYSYGAALAGREIRYQLADERLYTATTDAKGQVRFRLPTRQFSETQVLPLVVSLPERNLQIAANFFLACQGYAIAVSTVRPVFVAGESFETTIKTTDAEGKPVGQNLTLSVLERTVVEGKVGERLVEKHELQTAATDGTARKTLRLEKGGRYVLRAEGMDRFKNTISGQQVVQISDDEDRVRLRILADRHTFKVGDTAKVQIHWREEPALALVTFQGARVLDYKLVELAKGANLLEIPMTASLAPNFELAVAVMTDPRPDRAAKLPPAASHASPQRFHAASSPFFVDRDLRLSVTTRRQADAQTAPKPGEPIEVIVTTTDPQGKPAAAEVSLAMVEQALLERFTWPVPPIQEFFRGDLRQPAVRTTSSITFNYRPKTQPIDPQLLAEQDRAELAREEELSRLAAAAEAARAATRATEAGAGEAAQKPGETSRRQLDIPSGDASDLIMLRGERGGAPAANGAMDFLEQLGEGDFDARAVAGADEDRLRELGRRQSALGYQPAASALMPATGGGGFGARRTAGGRLAPAQIVNGQLLAGAAVRLPADREIPRGGKGEPRAMPPLPLGPQDTGYWNPAILTGPDGKAVLKLTLPERSTSWSLVAKGITQQTLAGESTGQLVVKKDLFGQLKLPAAFTDGDEAELAVTIHNDAVEKGQIEVTLKTTVGNHSTEEKKTLDVTAKGVHELAFKTGLKRTEAAKEEKPAAEMNAAFELTVTPGSLTDLVRRSVPLLPYGMPVFATTSGSATSDTTAWVEPPEGMPFQAPSLQILIGPSVQQSLLDIVLGPAPACQVETYRVASGLDTATSDLLAALGLQRLIAGAREGGGPQAQALDGRVRAAISLLVSSQLDDGGWSWTGHRPKEAPGGTSDRYVTARAVWALSLARRAKYPVPDDGYNKALAYLKNQMAAASPSDYETGAILLHALSTAGQGDFAVANRLYRERPSLSAAALAYLALSFVEMGRKATAGELLTLLGQRNLDDPALKRLVPQGALPWSHSPAELRALYALALQKVSPKSPQARQLVDWLWAHRVGHRWSPDKATGPAALALCEWFSAGRFEGEHYRLAVFVNDVQVQVLDIDDSSTTRTIDVPAKFLKPGRQRINFQITGRGQYTYQGILGGFVPAEAVKSTTDQWVVRRHHEPARLEMDGREIPRGFGILEGSYTPFRNPLTQLPVGRRGQVELEIWRPNLPLNVPEEQLEYLVITEPIPCGAAVVEGSVSGDFERFEIGPGAITFYVGTRRHVGSIRYQLVGYLPGSYRAAPTVIRNAYRPEQLAAASPKPLAVLAQGAHSADQYRLTPEELYELGKRHFEKGDFKTAAAHLTELLEGWKNLRSEVYKDAVQRLFDAHLELGPPARIVRYFEIIKEKWPAEEIPFAKIMKVAAAYHELGEYERSYLIFRATVESSFVRESGVAGFLDGQGEFLRSVQVMGRLLREYPPEPYVAAATYALAQRVYAKAPEAASDPKLREKKVNRIDLVRRAWRMLEGFLTAYPDDPAADQAAFAAANALLEMKSYDQAAAACNRYASRYPHSELLDSFWYIIGYCQFASGRHEQALEMCRRVAQSKRIDRRTGRETESPNKWRAIYILGQIAHSLGRAAEAIAEYRRVEDRFADAKEAIQYFLRKAIELPEVSTVQPGAPVEVELKFRNIAACDLKVYTIDLLKFGLLKRNLGGITQINLAGIRPYYEAAIPLGDGKDYRDRTRKLALPLRDEGAYLVVCRGEDLHASGLVLVTPLAVEVQEDVSSGRVRATVKDSFTGKYLNDVHVKVIGSRNTQFISGATDLRGVFIADGIKGTSTVIARAEPARYAFFRGQTDLVPEPPRATPPAAAPAARPAAPPPPEKPPADKKSLERELLEGVQMMNAERQQQQVEQLRQMYQRDQRGVEAQKAY
ncbi:MAG: tetratricopeptide repeat protein [Thermoguttaceae bacterium]